MTAKTLSIVGCAATLLLGAVACAGLPEPADKPTASASEEVKASSKKSKKVVTVGEGQYLVGEDIPAGTYKTKGALDSILPYCYWARRKDASGELDAIIASNGFDNGPGRVTVKRGEIFETNGCHDWQLVK